MDMNQIWKDSSMEDNSYTELEKMVSTGSAESILLQILCQMFSVFRQMFTSAI